MNAFELNQLFNFISTGHLSRISHEGFIIVDVLYDLNKHINNKSVAQRSGSNLIIKACENVLMLRIFRSGEEERLEGRYDVQHIILCVYTRASASASAGVVGYKDLFYGRKKLRLL